SAAERGRGADDLVGDHPEILDARLHLARQAVDGEADAVEPALPRPRDRLQALARGAVDRPVVEALVEVELEWDHARLLHLPAPVHRERPLEIGARGRPRRLLAGPDDQAARGIRGAWCGRRLLRASVAIHRDQARDVGPGYLRPEEHGVDQARCPSRGADALGAHLERWVRPLERRQPETRRAQRRVGALEVDLVTPPEPLHHIERLLELGHAVLAAEARRFELALAIADRDADVQAAVRDVIQGDHALGDV